MTANADPIIAPLHSPGIDLRDPETVRITLLAMAWNAGLLDRYGDADKLRQMAATIDRINARATSAAYDADMNPRYELFYRRTGGHGGPYYGLPAAQQAATRLLDGQSSEDAIDIRPYSHGWDKPGALPPFGPVVCTIRRLGLDV